MSEYLVIDNLTKIYPTPKGPAVIVKDFNLRIKKGEFVCLIGHSGCGKSTVLSMVAGLSDATGGGSILAGKELVGPGPDRGIVFQSPCLLPWLTALENVMLGVDQVFYTASKAERHQIAEYYLSVVGLADSMLKKPAELSQGMRQRVGIARAFALAPKMLLLDEPFGMLDSLTRMKLQQVLVELWRKDKKTALMVTHDVDEALFLADRIVCMTSGPAAEVGDILEVTFPRPRERKAVLAHPDYYRLREHLITFLEEHAHKKANGSNSEANPPPAPPPVAFTVGVPRPEPQAALLTPQQLRSEIRTLQLINQFMRIKLKTLSTGALVLAAAQQVYAQYTPPVLLPPFPGFVNEWLRKDDPYMNKWDIGGSVRGRFEVKDGYGIAGVPGSLDFRDHGADVDNEYFLEKIRFRAGYADKWWSALVEGESSLAQSDQRWAYANNPFVPGTVAKQGNGPEADSIELHQAIIAVGNHKEFPVSLKVGRMELSYGEERLIGAVGWNNIGRTFDAAKVRWQNEWFGVDLFASRPVIPQNGVFDVPNEYDYFSGVYATSTRVPKNTTDFYFLVRNASTQAAAAVPSPQFPQPSARDIYTVGMRLKSGVGEFGNWDYGVDGAYQFGNFRDTRAGAPTSRLDQSAYMFVLQGGYTFNDLWAKPRLGLEFSHGSGDSNPKDDQHETFENLFPTNHKFYGFMDFASLQNIQDVTASLTLKPTPRLNVSITGNLFWLADTHDNFYNIGGLPRGGVNPTPGTGYGVNPAYGSFVGTEIDIFAAYALTRYAQVEVGYGHFFAGDYIQSSLSNPNFGAQDTNFFYAKVNVTF